MEKINIKQFRDGTGSLHKPKKQKLYSELIEGEKILDIGFAEYPNPFLKNPIGIDVQETKRPRNYSKIHKVNLNKNTIPYPDDFFDSVIAGEIIEHVENPSFLLREINRVLKDKGKLIISTPHAIYYWEILRNLFLSSKESIDVGEHLSNWNILDFQRLLNKNGFLVNKKYGSVITIPLPFKRLYIPVQRFPKLSWIVIYDCYKSKEADNRIYTRKFESDSDCYYGKLTSEVIKISNG